MESRRKRPKAFEKIIQTNSEEDTPKVVQGREGKKQVCVGRQKYRIL